ncbi:hypothetical protein ABTM28_20855, partial [Acinetobacter baumannii]
RALQTQNAQGVYTGGMKVEAITGSAPATLQAGRVQLTGVRVYDDAAKTSLVSGNTTTTAWGLTGTNGLQTQATTFASSANQAGIL